MDTVYHFPLDKEFNEVGEPIAVRLLPDGSADISALPDNVRSHFASFGVPDALHQHIIMPQQGAAFLQGLLNMNSGYVRFRETPERRA